ncbi:delta-60 repeat domain-containing protein, partial [Pontibacter roseus]|uniref:delta-60 repeat domain-containing protein n=1 Tax=Pontibacter roseus TaxID=336989 RepID=UPI000526CF43
TSFNGTPRSFIARLNADGTLDASFNPGTGFNRELYSLALQPDGKVLVGGNFFSFNGTPRNFIARLNADGTLDASFNPGSGFTDYVVSLAFQPDGKVLVGGSFTSFNGTPRSRIARLNADGTLDAS